MTVGKIQTVQTLPVVKVRLTRRNPRIIGITGRMGAGKDATAALLSMVGYRRVAFADQVRAEVEQAGAARQAPDGMTPELAALFQDGLVTPSAVWEKPTGHEMRSILQWWGTDYRRSQDPDYWVRKVEAVIRGNLGWSWVVSDVRFPNEIEMIRRNGGKVWKVIRPGTKANGIPGHITERLAVVPDVVINNSGSIYDLAACVKNAL